MPPAGQHDSEGRWCCAASGMAFAVICVEQRWACAGPYAVPTHRKNHVIVTGGNYLADCAASGAALAVICREQHGDFVVACSEMPPSGQHDSGGRWCCAASGVAFAVIRREQQRDASLWSA
jgi:hypothetical protein